MRSKNLKSKELPKSEDDSRLKAQHVPEKNVHFMISQIFFFNYSALEWKLEKCFYYTFHAIGCHGNDLANSAFGNSKYEISL